MKGKQKYAISSNRNLNCTSTFWYVYSLKLVKRLLVSITGLGVVLPFIHACTCSPELEQGKQEYLVVTTAAISVPSLLFDSSPFLPSLPFPSSPFSLSTYLRLDGLLTEMESHRNNLVPRRRVPSGVGPGHHRANLF